MSNTSSDFEMAGVLLVKEVRKRKMILPTNSGHRTK